MNFLFFGELMVRLTPARPGERLFRADSLRMTPGGSEANSAVAIKSLGKHNARFLSALPNNDLGQNCATAVKSFGVEVSSLPSSSDRMGLYWLDMGSGPRASKVLYDRSDSAFSKINLESITEKDVKCDWFHSSGITPAISEQACSSLLHIFDFLPIEVPCSLDLNFRNKLWQWTDEENRLEIYKKLSRRVTLLTGNENDFQACLGIMGAGNTQDEIYSSIATVAFHEFSKLNFLAVSLRQSHSATLNTWGGMLFVRDGGSFNTFKSPSIEIDSIVDRLGTGDSFTAGILHGLASYNNDFCKIIDFAVMLSALNHTIYGDFSSITEGEVFQSLRGQGKGIIQR